MSPSPRSRRRSRPKFELPAESASSNAAVGWVYRADEPPTPVIPIASASTPEEKPAAAPIDIAKPDYSHPLLVAGTGMFFIGAGTLGVAAMATLTLIAAPVRMLKGLFGR